MHMRRQSRPPAQAINVDVVEHNLGQASSAERIITRLPAPVYRCSAPTIVNFKAPPETLLGAGSPRRPVE